MLLITWFCFLVADPPDLNPDLTQHQTSHQHKPRRGRPRHSNDRHLSNNSNETCHQYGPFNQGTNPPFSHRSNYEDHHRPPYQGGDEGRRRGRGRGWREGNRGGSVPWRQRPGGDPYGGSNRYMSGVHAFAHPMGGADGPNWRRGSANRDTEQTNEDQDAQAKKPRKFSQEQRKGEHNGSWKENNTTVEDQRKREDSESQHDNNQRKHTDPKRRQGPIKPPKQPSQEEPGSEKGASGQDDSDQGRASQDSAGKGGRGSGGNAPLQARGGRRANYQNYKPGQRSWNKMPKSKETQTGLTLTSVKSCLAIKFPNLFYISINVLHFYIVTVLSDTKCLIRIYWFIYFF